MEIDPTNPIWQREMAIFEEDKRIYGNEQKGEYNGLKWKATRNFHPVWKVNIKTIMDIRDIEIRTFREFFPRIIQFGPQNIGISFSSETDFAPFAFNYEYDTYKTFPFCLEYVKGVIDFLEAEIAKKYQVDGDVFNGVLVGIGEVCLG